ncbi:MAG: phosphotransferase, partial [Pseudomonadota bacterium]
MNAPAERRAVRRERFLKAAGWRGAIAKPLAGDASNRRYERLEGDQGRSKAVLMDAPPKRGEDVRPFLAVTKRLRDAGFSAPEIYFADETEGFLLLEDLGDALFARVCASDPALERPLYAAAGALLAEIQARPAAENGFDPPPYDVQTLLREAVLAVDWWWKGVCDPPSDAAKQRFEGLIRAACAPVSKVRDALVLRDYHAENLVWLSDRRGSARVGLLDYQDALAGHGAYDLISLLEDARRDVSQPASDAAEDAFFAESGADREAFSAASAILAAQRNLKIIGIFAR